MGESRSLTDHIRNVGREYPDTEVVVYCGPILRPYDDEFVSQLGTRRALQKNLILILDANGSDAEAAYRMARALHRRCGLPSLAPPGAQPRLSVFVDSRCASAGTLIAAGATDLIMSENAELRPLDAHLPTPHGTAGHSALALSRAFENLQTRYASLFHEQLERWTRNGATDLPDRAAVEMSSAVATGLLAPFSNGLDPASLGDANRVMASLAAYGERLARFNLKPGALERLLNGYPSSDFIIDRSEAEELFHSVAAPRPALRALADYLRRSLPADAGREPAMYFLTEPSHTAEPLTDPVPLQPVPATAHEPAAAPEPRDRPREVENLESLLKRPPPAPAAPVKRGKIEERVAAVWHNEIYA
jgi:hypothetical protein